MYRSRRRFAAVAEPEVVDVAADASWDENVGSVVASWEKTRHIHRSPDRHQMRLSVMVTTRRSFVLWMKRHCFVDYCHTLPFAEGPFYLFAADLGFSSERC